MATQHSSRSLLCTLALLLACIACQPTLARPLVSPYASLGQCFHLNSPQDLLKHPLVVMGDARSTDIAEDALTSLLTGLSRDFALRLCRNIALQEEEQDLLQDTTDMQAQAQAALSPHRRQPALPLELFDCDILVGDFPLGVAAEFEKNKEPVHAVYFVDPVEATLAAYQRIMALPSHPMHHRLSAMSLHEAIVEAGGLADTERHHASLPLNPMTWRLCGLECSPLNMTIHEALQKAIKNMNTRVVAVLTEGSAWWNDMLQTYIKDQELVSSAKRTPKPSTLLPLTPAERGILEHANFADRLLMTIAQGREDQQGRCVRNVKEKTRVLRGMLGTR